MRITNTAWKAPTLTAELGELVDRARERERQVRFLLENESARQVDVVRRLIVGDAADACAHPLDTQLPLEDLCERALEAANDLRLLVRMPHVCHRRYDVKKGKPFYPAEPDLVPHDVVCVRMREKSFHAAIVSLYVPTLQGLSCDAR